MKPMLIYLLETLFCSGLLLLFYRLLVVERVSLAAARCYLIGAMVASAIIPALQLPLYPAETLYYAVPIIETATTTMSATDTVEPMQTIAEAVHWNIPWSEAVMILYGIVVVVAFVLFIVHLRKIARLRRRAICTATPRYTLAESDEIQSPFSFWRTIFLGTGYDPLEREQIIAHEAAHIRRHHTADKLFIEFLRILYWFNPFLWLAERRLSEIHEYQADRDVLAEGYDITQYRLTIFKQLFGYNPDIACGLSNSFTKKRFNMMTQSSARRRSLWRIGAAIPLMAVLVLAFGATARQATPTTRQSDSTLVFHRPSDGNVLMSRFGTTINPLTGKTSQHNGVDIVLSKGAPIYTVADGVVTFAGEKGGYGNLIEIAHNEGYTSRYAHLDRVAVSVGDSVVRGRRIATAGDSGRTTGPHLHFELQKDGNPIDPTPIIQASPNTSYAHVSSEGIYINGERIEEEELAEHIGELRKQSSNSKHLVLVLNADHTARMGNITHVKEAMREANVLRLRYGDEAERILPPKAEPIVEHGVELMTSFPRTVKSRNLFMIYINAKGDIMCGTGTTTKMHRNLEGVSDYLERFLTNPNNVRELSEQQTTQFTLPDGRTITHPVNQGYVSLVTRGETPAKEYIALLQTISDTYTRIRTEVAQTHFGKSLSALTSEELQLIYEMVPMRVGE